VKRRHEERLPYYRWYTRGWLDLPRDTPVLDIGCGSGQFLYFLRAEGFTNAVGIDLDARQVELGRSLGLDCRHAPAADFLAENPGTAYGVVAMIDILEHFTRDELYPLMETVVGRMPEGGLLIASVPNADSLMGLGSTYADITHELSFTPISLTEMLFCHGLRINAMLDPWPAPVGSLRSGYRAVCQFCRGLERVRLRLLGYERPRYWSTVVWALAEKKS
jgi:2-polyprenyl-3-methyl-5-hydroxy-6-metoxy-1,4-benzoquinol methylase